MKIEPYLHFSGQAEEAIAFYQRVLNAQLETRLRFAESPVPFPAGQLPPGFESKIMHASLLINGARIMLSDGGGLTGQGFAGFSLSIEFASEPEAQRAFGMLAEGGQVVMPMGPTFWSACFGMVTDRFGVQWMLTIGKKSSV